MVVVRTEQPFLVFSLQCMETPKLRVGVGRRKMEVLGKCIFVLSLEFRGSPPYINKVLKVCSQLYLGLCPQLSSDHRVMCRKREGGSRPPYPLTTPGIEKPLLLSMTRPKTVWSRSSVVQFQRWWRNWC